MPRTATGLSTSRCSETGRSITRDGSHASIHRVPWQDEPLTPLQEDVWELYNIEDDFSSDERSRGREPREAAGAAGRSSSREAIANNVYPLDDRVYERFNAALAGRPDLMGDRTTLTLADGMDGILENTFLNVKNHFQGDRCGRQPHGRRSRSDSLPREANSVAGLYT